MAGGMRPSGGGERRAAQATGSGAARGAGQEDRLAKGGVEPALVAVTVSAADLAAFKKAGGLKYGHGEPPGPGAPSPRLY